MARRAIDMFDLQNLLHWWQQGHSQEFIRKTFGVDPKTTRKYIKLAEEVGITRQTPLSPESLQPFLERVAAGRKARVPSGPTQELLAPYRAKIAQLLGIREGQSEPPDPQAPTLKTAWRRLIREGGTDTSYSAFKRYVRATFPNERKRVTIVMPTTPGDAAQVDFGYVGLMADRDARQRKTWAFVITLAHSRHMFVRFVTAQDQSTWVRCHIEAWEFFGGVVERVLLDNLKAGVVKPDLYDPEINRAYADCSRHYKFTPDPCRVRTPTDKAKVERMVPYVRDALVRGYGLNELISANETARHWCLTEAGQRTHGTLGRRPVEIFEEEERRRLKPLPMDRFEIPQWKHAKVHPDHHVVFGNGFYSLPTRYVGEKVWVRGTATAIQFFDATGYLIRTWDPASHKARWRTNWEDYPPGKRAFLVRHPRYCREKAAEFGPSVLELIDGLLKGHAHTRLRKVQALLRLGEQFGATRLDGACARALLFGDLEYSTVKNILTQALELETHRRDTDPEKLPAQEPMYLRPADSFVHDPEDSLEGKAA